MSVEWRGTGFVRCTPLHFLQCCSKTCKPSHQVHPQSFWGMQMPRPHPSLGNQNLSCLAEKSSTSDLGGHQKGYLWSQHNQDLAQGLPRALPIHSPFLNLESNKHLPMFSQQPSPKHVFPSQHLPCSTEIIHLAIGPPHQTLNSSRARSTPSHLCSFQPGPGPHSGWQGVLSKCLLN